jgi:hypothetical protein
MTNFRSRMRVSELDMFRPTINNRAINEQFVADGAWIFFAKLRSNP